MIDLPLGLALSPDDLAAFASELPGDVLLFFFLARILPMRHKPAFWAVALGLRAFFVLLAAQVFSAAFGQVAGGILGVALILFQTFVLPALFCPRGQRGRGLLLTALTSIVYTGAGALADSVLRTLETALTTSGTWGEPLLGSVFSIIGYALVICALCVLDALVRRLSRREVGHGAWPYLAALALALFSILATELAKDVSFGAEAAPGWATYTLTALHVTFIGAALALVFSVERFGRQQRARQRAEMLGAELDEVLAGYADVNTEVESVARLRHDLKNQLLTVSELLRRGELDAAEAHLARTADDLAEDAGHADAGTKAPGSQRGDRR